METSVLAALIGGVLHFLLGWAWYAPQLFGNAWLASIGKPGQTMDMSNKKGMLKKLLFSLSASIFISAATVHTINLLQTTSFLVAIKGLVFPALGFVLAPLAMGIEYEQKKWSYFFINGGYFVTGILLTAAIITLLF